MITISQLLEPIFNYKRNIHPEYNLLLDRFYTQKEAIHVKSIDFGVTGSFGHIHESKDGIEAILYIPDYDLEKESEAKCPTPFQFIPDCNYMYYGCYMSLAAYLHPANITHITLYLPVKDNDRFVLKYRPEIAQLLLRYKKSLDQKQNGHQLAQQLSL